jgi:hypothetical protein
MCALEAARLSLSIAALEDAPAVLRRDDSMDGLYSFQFFAPPCVDVWFIIVFIFIFCRSIVVGSKCFDRW